MRLEEIKLVGFKSFVDATKVQFPSNLVGVVGPNGCGKSNIIDAVRWVMGESSAKNLRGESITDVIFNGTTERKPIGQASIELIFDNREGKLGGAYAQYAQISVKRVVDRETAQSNYYLNGSRCRRRDITDAFLGTGLGARSYSIIEQGMISRLIEAKPEDLRVHLEEASGISKYKERRKEAENHMKRAEENLTRHRDHVLEIEKLLNRLERQAKTAEKYKVLKQDERNLRAWTQAIRWQHLTDSILEEQKTLETLTTQHISQTAQLQSYETELVALRDQRNTSNDDYQQIQSQYYQLTNLISRAEQDIHHFKERKSEHERHFKDVEQQLNAIVEDLTMDNELLKEKQAQQTDADPKLLLAQEKANQLRESVNQAQTQMSAWQSSWDEFNQGAAKVSEVAEVEKTRIQHIEQQQSSGQRRLHQLQEEQNQISLEGLEDEREKIANEIQEIKNESKSKEEEIQQHIHQLNTAKQQLETTRKERDQQESERQRAEGRLSSLEVLQQSALGKNDNVVVEWLKQHHLFDQPRLAECIQVENAWELAVETVLSHYLDSVCTSFDVTTAQALSALEQGNIVLFAENVSCEVQDNPSRLSHKIQAKPAIKSLLQSIHVASSLEDAFEKVKQLPITESVITQDGVWVSPAWIRVNKSENAGSGVLQRENEIKELKELINQLNKKLSELNNQVDDNKQTVTQLENTLSGLQEALQSVKLKQAQLDAAYQFKNNRLEQMQKRQQQLGSELLTLQQEQDELSQKLLDARHEWQQALQSIEQDSGRREQLLSERDKLREEMNLLQKQWHEAQSETHQLNSEHQTIAAQVRHLTQNIERLTQQKNSLEQRYQALKKELDQGDQPLLELQEKLQQHLEEKAKVEEKMTQAKQQLESIDAAIVNNERLTHELQQTMQSLRDSQQEKQMRIQECDVRRKTLAEQLEESGTSVEAALSSLPEEHEEKALQSQLDSILTSIERLGPINLAAIEEYETESERKKYLDQQGEDLEKALTTLQNAIRKIDHETRELFKQTYDVVNEHFKTYFPKIFGGGQGYLQLTGDDLLETGVTVMARPPGKKNSTIHLLSGGEKALTAIALVLSFFQLNPAPFCMLDEVDAPLDDANVSRYCNLIQDMAQKVQFIFISHNKVAMEMAQHLIGVTMNEPGVSRIVSVDIDEAVAMAEA